MVFCSYGSKARRAQGTHIHTHTRTLFKSDSQTSCSTDMECGLFGDRETDQTQVGSLPIFSQGITASGRTRLATGTTNECHAMCHTICHEASHAKPCHAGPLPLDCHAHRYFYRHVECRMPSHPPSTRPMLITNTREEVSDKPIDSIFFDFLSLPLRETIFSISTSSLLTLRLRPFCLTFLSPSLPCPEYPIVPSLLVVDIFALA